MNPYFHRRIVSWIAHHVSRGDTPDGIRQRNHARRVPFEDADLDACMEKGIQAVRNAELIGAELRRRREARELAQLGGATPPVFPPLRICDIEGCEFPEGKPCQTT